MTDTATDTTQRDQLIGVNVEFSARERFQPNDNESWFGTYLDETFVFRRAGRTVTGRAGYIAGLTHPGNTTEYIQAAILDVAVADNVAAVTAVVGVRGTRGRNPVDGQFTNRRLFATDGDGQWRCVGWWNEPIPDRVASDPIDGAATAVAHYSPDASGS